jgi:hypothetical protein
MDRTYILLKARFGRDSTPVEPKIIKTDDQELESQLSRCVQAGKLFKSFNKKTFDFEYFYVHRANVVWDTGVQWKDGLSKNRFIDKNELKYSMRSLERYAPWIRNVYIVTNGQVPAWLNQSHPRVRIVTHDEIFPNKSHLPTFNSAAIESHLHKIENLSEHFLYYNDDTLLTAPIGLVDFYSIMNQAYKLYGLMKVSSDAKSTCEGSSEYSCSLKHVQALFEKKFKTHLASPANMTSTRRYFVPPHMPFLLKRNLIDELKFEFASEFEKTSASCFRSPNDMQYGFAYFNYLIARFRQLDHISMSNLDVVRELNVTREQLADCNRTATLFNDSRRCNQIERLIEQKKSQYRFELVSDARVKFITLSGRLTALSASLKVALNFRQKFLCINDDIDYAKKNEVEMISEMLRQFYESLFPDKSSFEI